MTQSRGAGGIADGTIRNFFCCPKPSRYLPETWCNLGVIILYIHTFYRKKKEHTVSLFGDFEDQGKYNQHNGEPTLPCQAMYLKRVFQRNFNQPPNGLGNDDQLFCNCFFLLMICIYIHRVYIYVYLDAIPTNNKNITWQRIKGLHLRTTEKLTTQGWEGNQTT